MNRATFNSLPSVDSLATAVLPVSAGGIAVGSYFLLDEDTSQQNNNNVRRVTYFQRIKKARDNGTFPNNSLERTNKVIPGFDFDAGGTIALVNGRTNVGAWPSGAVSYPSAGPGPSELDYQDFLPGVSQLTDGYVRINDVLED